MKKPCIFGDVALRISHIGSTAVPSLTNIGYIVNTPPIDINL